MRETRATQIVAAALVLVALTLVGVKWLVAGITPNRVIEPLWHINVRLGFRTTTTHTSVRLFAPRGGGAQVLMSEHFDDDQVPRLTINSANSRNRSIRWRETRAEQSHVLGYSAWFEAAPSHNVDRTPDYKTLQRLRRPTKMIQVDDPAIRQASLIVGNRRGRDAMDVLLQFAHDRIKEGGDEAAVSAVRCLKSKEGGPRSRSRLLCALLRAQNIPCQLVGGVRLEEDVRTHAFYWVEAWDGSHWLTLCPTYGVIDHWPVEYLPTFRGDYSLAKFRDCTDADVLITVEKQLPPLHVQAEMARRSASLFDRYSLSTLPADVQPMVGLLLLLPVGGLIVACFRNLVGMSSFGIFMPMLLALAFRETGLTWGLVYLIGIVTVGVVARQMLNRLKLLMVPRLTTVLTVIVVLMIGVIFVGSRYGIHAALAVGLFPLVIMSTTVERFFVLQSEDGTAAALKEAGQTALVATCGYLMFKWRWFGTLMFIYPELLLIVVALLLLLGRYSGYRLLELRRFRWLTWNQDAALEGTS